MQVTLKNKKTGKKVTLSKVKKQPYKRTRYA